SAAKESGERRPRLRGDALYIVGPEPGGAPRVGESPPYRERTVGRIQRIDSAFLRAHDRGGVVWLPLDAEARPDRRRHPRRQPVIVEQRQRRGGAAARAARRLARDLVEPRADEAVAGAQVMIEEGERTVGGERAEPERQPRQLYGGRIQIDAVQAALRHQAPEGGPIGGRDVGGGERSVPNECRFIGVRKI